MGDDKSFYFSFICYFSNLVRGKVTRLKAKRVPHMGWNTVESEDGIMDGISSRHFYFAHSYYARPADPGIVVAATDYGDTFPAVVESRNIFGLQFHPEKSSRLGLNILRNFAEIVNESHRI